MQFGFLHAQYVVKDAAELETIKKLPLEKIYVHSNSSVFFPGEYLYYSVFCQNAVTNKLSTTSRVGYLELIGENGERFFRQKIPLVQGRGQGDFFIPVTLSSGNYKLLAYTQWMRNAGVSQFYQDEIVVINPYQSNQENLLNPENDSNKPNALESIKTDIAPYKEDKSIQLQTDRKEYGKREKVSLVVRNYKGPLSFGDYSISVRQKSTLNVRPAMNATTYGTVYLNSTKILKKNVNDSIFLPEQRGELFYGQVIDANENPVEDETVIISIPGEDFQLKSAITDKAGNFYTYVNKPYNAPVIIAQTLETDVSTQKVLLNEKSTIDYGVLEFGNFMFDKDMKKAILERSIHNQIENAYYSAKPDSVLTTLKVDPFDGGTPEIINLDEFTRFPTLRETLVELVPNVWVKKLENGSYTFWVREKLEKYENEFESDPPLVLVDGIFVPNHSRILDFNARLIKTIRILRDPLVLGDKKYLGMVVIETNDGDYLNRMGFSNKATKDLQLPTKSKNYFNQSYSLQNSNKFNHIPDFRSQLYWNPTIIIDQDSNERTYEFYTSDLEGEYELTLEGFTTYGKPISIKETISIN
jgi:hypothetical protein